MAHKEIYEIFTLVANDKYTRISAIAVTALTVILSIFFSPLAGLIVYGSYITGYLLCWALIKYQSFASIYLQSFISFCYAHNTSRKLLKNSCSICDDLSCKRHQQNKVVTPWKHLCIPKELNNSLEEFYNRILENFICSWYGQFTEDTDFINELRYCLKYASAVVINKFLELDHAKIIATKLLPAVIKHIDDYLYMQQIVKLKNARINDVIVEYLGKRLHVAVASRKNELGYLQHLAGALMPQILPEQYLKCRNYSILVREIIAGWVLLPMMDVLADPNIINYLIILAASYKSKKGNKPRDCGANVEFLEHFVVGNVKKSSFATDLNTIKENTDLLYAFMQFMKREEHVHLLQFCLDVDDFNNKLLTPDLSKKQLEELHSEALILYREYLNNESLNFIGCSEEISTGFYSLIKDGVYNVAKLRTSKPLYQAYEYTFNLLENIWLPCFFHSNEFYSHICGSKVTATYSKSQINRAALLNFGSPIRTRGRKYYENTNQGTVAKISSGLGKIKGALKASQPIEGALYPPETQTIEDGGVEDIIITECGNIFRDLSAWRVSILSYQSHNKVVSFCINVQRLDIVDEDGRRHWVILRRDQDFYTLKAKLVEFHGENEICDSPLPSRKAGSPLDVRMAKYESFLTRLLQKPSLRGSDLLHTFLTAEEDFSVLISTSAQTNQDIGNIYQSVAHKLRKERGQHLDSFMSTFLASTGKTKQGKFEWAEIGDEIDMSATNLIRNPPIPKTFRNHIFNDNFGIQFKGLKDTSSTSFNPECITQCLFYLLKYVFKTPHYLLRLYAAICSVFQEAVELLASIIIERKLKSSLSPGNLNYLIKLIQDAVFLPHTSPSRAELDQRKLQAFSDLKTMIPPWSAKIFGNNFASGFSTLLEILQHPHYNKQLAYNLLDLILIEMYPTLGNNK